MSDTSFPYPQFFSFLLAAIALIINAIVQHLRANEDKKAEIINYTTKDSDVINAEINTLSALLSECLRGRDDQVLAALVRAEAQLEKIEEMLDLIREDTRKRTYNRTTKTVETTITKDQVKDGAKVEKGDTTN